MKLVLLPGLDGTGMLFKPFMDALPSGFEAVVVAYPSDKKMTYNALCEYVMKRLPKDEDYVLLGESFSGPIAYNIALKNPKGMRSVVFVASFLINPRPFVIGLSRILPMSVLLTFPMPGFVIKAYMLGTHCSDEKLSHLRQTLKNVSPGVLSFRLKQMAKLTNKHQISTMKAVYIQAKNDKLVLAESVDAFEEAFKKLRTFQVEGPHFILQASPLACAEIVANEMHHVMNLSRALENC